MIPIRYSLRSLGQRRRSVAMTGFGIALVVALFVSMGAFVEGLAGTFEKAGSDRSVIVTRKGSLAESMSAVSRESVTVLRELPEVARDHDRSAASPEVVTIWIVQSPEGADLSLSLRGLTDAGYAAHPGVKVLEGRRPVSGSDEAMLGRALVGKAEGFRVGGSFQLGRRKWRVVGVFDDLGGPAASEIWGPVEGVMDGDRRTDFSSVLLPLAPGASADRLIARVESDRRFSLHAQRERDYFQAQAGSAEPMRVVTAIVALIMGLGAVFGALNTMYASLAGRTREVATLRALGFPGSSIAAAFVTESLLVAVPAGILGCLLALPVEGREVATLNMWTFSQVAFSPRITPAVLAAGLGFSLVIGLLGGLWPARAAASTPLSVQLRR